MDNDGVQLFRGGESDGLLGIAEFVDGRPREPLDKGLSELAAPSGQVVDEEKLARMGHRGVEA
jgi:hypothetical protein